MQGMLIYITGFSGSGKTTIAEALRQVIPHAVLLDGDIIRRSVSKDLGYDVASKMENIRRNNELMKMMYDQGFVVIASFMASIEEERDKVFETCTNNIKIQLTTPLEICIRRDTKGLYKNNTKNLAGVSARYSPFKTADLFLDTSVMTVEDCVVEIFHKYKELR